MQDELWVALPDKNGDGLSDGTYKFANMGNSPTATHARTSGPAERSSTRTTFS